MAKIKTHDTVTPERTGVININKSVEEFIHSRIAEGRSAQTVRYYIQRLRLFTNWIAARGIATWDQITLPHLREYLIDLDADGRTQGGVHANYRAVRALMRWVWDEYDLTTRCPADKWRCKNRQPAPIPGITIEEVDKLMTAAQLTNYPERDKAFLAVLVDTGLRRAEIMNLTMRDVNLTDMSIRVEHGKGDKPRTVYFGRDTKRLLRKYLNQLEDVSQNDPFWISRYGEALTDHGARSMLRRLYKISGVPDYGFHAFRRCFALERKRNGDDALTVSRALGHSSLEVTKRYLAFTADDDRAFALRASPMDNRKRK